MRSKYAGVMSAETFAAVLATHTGHRFNRPAPVLTAREQELAEAVLVDGQTPYQVAKAKQASLATIYPACRRVLALARIAT